MTLQGKKILFVGITDSGVVRVRSEMINWMISEGAKVIVATPKKTDYVKLQELGCKFIEFKLDGHGMNPIKDYIAYRNYIKLLKEEKPDVVLTFTTKPNIYCTLACRKTHTKYITNVTGRGQALGNPGYKQVIMSFLLRLSLKNASCIFFQNSNDMKFFLEKKIGQPNSYRRIPGSGVNLKKYIALPYPECKGEIHFLFISRILKQKGIDNYIEAAREIRKEYPECVFHVLGETTPDYEDIIHQANKEGAIIFHGRVNNVAEFIRNSHCTIHPSYYPEGMANVILESAASSRPVITTNHPGCREGVEDGITGFIIKPNDTFCLIEAIRKFLALSYEQKSAMGKAGQIKIAKEFDRNIVDNAYKEEILKIIRIR